MIQGYYYLHENKELIYKRGSDAIVDIRESDLCISAWAFDEQRKTAWQILVEALSLNANKERIFELARKWGCDDEDALIYAKYLNINLEIDGSMKTATCKNFVNLQESPCGFGETYLEALADLCKQLGFKGGKLWNKTFEDLVKNNQQ